MSSKDKGRVGGESSAPWDFPGTQADGDSPSWNTAISSCGFQGCCSREKKTGVSCKMFARPKSVLACIASTNAQLAHTYEWKEQWVISSPFIPWNREND